MDASGHIPGLTLGTGLALASGLMLATGLTLAAGLADASATGIHSIGMNQRGTAKMHLNPSAQKQTQKRNKWLTLKSLKWSITNTTYRGSRLGPGWHSPLGFQRPQG